MWNSRASSSAMNRYLSDIFITNRQDGAIIGLCVPTLEMLDINVLRLAHFVVEAKGGPSNYAVNVVQRWKYVQSKFGRGGEWTREYLRNPYTRKTVHWFGVAKPRYIPLEISHGPINYEEMKRNARGDIDARWKKYFAQLDRREDAINDAEEGEKPVRKPRIG